MWKWFRNCRTIIFNAGVLRLFHVGLFHELLPFVIVIVMTLHPWKRTLHGWTARRKNVYEGTWRIKINLLSLELSHVNTKIFVIFFAKIEIFDLHAVSIFATGTGESDTTTHLPFCKLWNTIQRNNQCNEYNDENY